MRLLGLGLVTGTRDTDPGSQHFPARVEQLSNTGPAPGWEPSPAQNCDGNFRFSLPDEISGLKPSDSHGLPGDGISFDPGLESIH